MKEGLIESFLEAGKYLNIDGITGDTSDVHLTENTVNEVEDEDCIEEVSEEFSDRHGIMNSTRTYEVDHNLSRKPLIDNLFTSIYRMLRLWEMHLE